MLAKRFETLDVLEQVRPLLKGVSGQKIVVPGIVVVGAQSSGKSSVLEHATGLAFPRGEGMCTRVPTVVSVQGGCTEASLTVSIDPDFAEANPLTRVIAPGDAAAFGNAIQELTDRLTSVGQISAEQIYVRLKQAGGPTFTLTDVPGITCMASGAARPSGASIEQTTTALTRKMIGTDDETLVLVVLPATDDFHNSKALQLAMELDPEGHRTIGVVTKIDNLPPGSDLVHRMSGDDIPLRHGFFAVRNRTQEEINNDVDLSELEDEEESLFESDAVLQLLPMEQRGMPRLLEKVYEEQGKKLDEFVPKMKTQIQERLREDAAALAKLPTSMDTEAERLAFLNRTLGRIESDFRQCASSDTSILGADCKETNLSARINEAMMHLADAVRNNVRNFRDDEVKQELRAASAEALGYNLSNFMQGAVFRTAFASAVSGVLKEESETALASAEAHVQACFEALVDHHVGTGVLPSVRAALKQLFRDTFQVNVANTGSLIARLQQSEANVTFTTNHYYAQTIAKFEQMLREHADNWRRGGEDGVKNGQNEGLDEEFMRRVTQSFRNESNDATAVRTMQVSLYAYSKVVRKRFCDTVATVIINELVAGTANAITDSAHSWAAALVDKVKEDPSVARGRQTLKNNLERLQKAQALLQQV